MNEAAALLSQPASREALDGLQRLFIAARKRKTDVETWCSLALRALDRTPPADRAMAGSFRMMVHAAAHCLREHGNAEHVPELLAIGERPHTDAHYVVSLLGMLGKPTQLAAMIAWFNELPGKRISYTGASAPYAVMVDTIVRLKTGNVALVKKQLAPDSDELVLTRYHRFTYEKALERMRAGAPPNYGTSLLAGKPPG